ncbi:MAG: hypothetical protein IBJ11_07580 [Phycisphaerales bacterium]|nr:hypothetical protein [Phycisphaerales bacterium]
MTTAHIMLSLTRRLRSAVLALAAASSGLGLAGCSGGQRLENPTVLDSPYGGGGPAGPVILAVAPLRNESGVGVVNELVVSDQLVSQLSQVRGVTALPMNRTLGAMRALNLPQVTTAGEALALARAAGADGIVVGAITAWNPYEPLSMGLNLALFGRSPSLKLPSTDVDPARLRGAASDGGPRPMPGTDRPLSVVAVMLDASNHATLAEVQAYARGRHDPASAMGWERFVKSMTRYTEFVCFAATDRLMRSERARVAPARSPEHTQASAAPR